MEKAREAEALPLWPFPFLLDSSFFPLCRLSLCMLLSILCTCQVEYRCIINDPAVLSFTYPSICSLQWSCRPQRFRVKLGFPSAEKPKGELLRPTRLPSSPVVTYTSCTALITSGRTNWAGVTCQRAERGSITYDRSAEPARTT